MSTGDVRSSSRSGAETEKNPGKVAEPIRGNTVGAESIFEPSVKAFNEAVRLGRIGSGGLVGDVEGRAEGSPERRGELRTLVRSDGVR